MRPSVGYAYTAGVKASYPGRSEPGQRKLPGTARPLAGPDLVAYLICQNEALRRRVHDLEGEVARLRGARPALERN